MNIHQVLFASASSLDNSLSVSCTTANTTPHSYSYLVSLIFIIQGCH